MITHFELVFSSPKGVRVQPQWAYPFYSVLCEKMPPSAAELLHSQEITPLRQNIVAAPKNGELVWALDVFDDALATALAPVLLQLREVKIDKAAEKFEVLEQKEPCKIEIADLLKEAATEGENRLFRFCFKTTTGFKSDGQYVLYPTAELILKSLVQRWNVLFPMYPLQDDDALRMMVNGLRIVRYDLRSSSYAMKGLHIPGFWGEVTIKSTLPAPLLELWKLLVAFAPYSGVGIKTALGMGAVAVEN